MVIKKTSDTTGGRDSSARHRQKLKEQGMRRVEVWVPQDRVLDIRYIAAQLAAGSMVSVSPARRDQTEMTETEDMMSSLSSPWTIDSLKKAMEDSTDLATGEFGLEIMDGGVHDAVLCVTVKALGDLPLYVAIQPDQILTTTPLWRRSDQEDAADFEAMMLRSHKVHLPLCALSIDMIDGAEWYELFGSMSSRSSLHSVVTEFRAVAASAIELARDLGPRALAS